MNKRQILFSALALLITTGLFAQKSKTFNESFSVGNDAVLNINTSHADIEFETWNKNQVEIEAVITLEGATDEEAEDYFKNLDFEIKGNSKEIDITTGVKNSWLFSNSSNGFEFADIDFGLEPLVLDLELPNLPELAVLPEMPALPSIPPIKFNFDYSKYQKEGEDYLKEWAENFEESFGEDYQKEMEEWGKRMEEQAQEWEERNADRLERMEKRMEERAAEMEKRQAEREKRREEQIKEREEAMEKRHEAEAKRLEKLGNRWEWAEGDSPSIFYFSSDGMGKKYEVKKTIKIKMPKSVKLKMNVKHGEVKLAANTKQINASLRYASLLASDISGKYTNIDAAYSPMVIERWNAGKLSTKYSDKVKLTSVKDLNLTSTSSNITIDRVLNDVYIVNDLGNTIINSVDDNFKSVYVSLKNGQLNAVLPKADCNVNIIDRLSDVSYPNTINANVVKTSNGYEIQGCVNAKKNNNPTFEVKASFSEVVIK
ncbi:hypothetical protein [Croceivirga thetidis]|uniref:Adhesin domain-containing protein n=1 Tax=Croceivirga thetidis TaxID=2721623 RepID=A0ABX1GSG3_9FLAO|nr:hypothetical protein [Croceivirga thetidis]NKI32887.1 hypothetical protein [Croceivirga thetidis]